MNIFSNKKGFTLIELLVVIAIISLLSSIIISSFGSARMKARDARRIADLSQIKLALELYRDTYGYYPQANCGWDCNEYRYSYDGSWNSLAADLAPFISSLPRDPINSTCPPWNNGCYSYTYGNVGRATYGSQYDLTAQLEDPNHPQRCQVKGWFFYFAPPQPWCVAFGGSYSNFVYEASN